jgi:two-component system, NtrC family, response regulator AtoC
VESLERSMIIEALVNADWIQTKAALTLGLSERMLRYKIKKYNIVRSPRS